ncbi:MAG: BON domain-containing protein [Gammaproteobacteria bacterium]|nr:BON domain-containing protein [Gammaproteobacteria bacterium]
MIKYQTLKILGIAVISSVLLNGCAAAVVAGGAAAGNSAASSLPIGTQVDDITIKSKVLHVLDQYPQLQNNSNVEVTVFNHIVLLLGQVPTQDLSEQIAKDVSKLPDVRVVYNQMTVGKPVSMSTYARDSWITTSVKASLIGKVNPAAFKVVTENGVVYLLAVTNKADGDIAANVASKTSGVKQVVKAYFYAPEQLSTDVSDKKSTDNNNNSDNK